MRQAFILSAKRSAVVPQNGAFGTLDIHDLGAPVLRAALSEAGIDPSQVGEVIVSNALGAGGNPARHVALAAGLPDRVAGLSIDRQCAGGLDAIALAAAMVASGQHEVVVAGGVESHSRRPLRQRTFADRRAPEPYDQARFTPWPDRDPNMAEAAGALAQRLGLSRAEQDDYAAQSHAKALAAQSRTSAEILPLNDVTNDQFTRDLTRVAPRAKPITGSITPANMAVAADAAAFVVVASRSAISNGAKALRIASSATVGGDPELPGLAPIASMDQALKSAGATAQDLATAEIMEAFAVQAMACIQGAGLDPQIVNPNGGALARGHPIGASGTILAVSLFHNLRRKPGLGVAAIASAGGLGAALVLDAG